MKINKRDMIRISILFITILLIIPFSGCNKIENLSDSGSKLIIMDITGLNLESKASHTAFSDVLLKGSVVNDVGTVVLNAKLLDPTATTSTYYQSITVDQIDVEYFRTDGLNTQGLDVPYSFTQKFATTVPVGSDSVSLDFILVNHNAKLEQPLINLVNGGAEHILKLDAKITVHGKDGAGNRVSPVVGYISVWCANFADPEEEEENTGG